MQMQDSAVTFYGLYRLTGRQSAMTANNTNRDHWVDNLRSAITLLVVAHHASLSYTSFASFNKDAYILSTHPVVDPHRWVGMDIFENYNDIFFMFLMFFIGGLFLVKSVQKKGGWQFTKDRFSRLFIPFLFPGTVLMLIAYFPAWIIAKNNTNIEAYVKDFFTIEAWPVGPPWFIWVLFAFNALFAFVYPLAKNNIARAGMRLDTLQNKPFLFFMLLLLVTWILYVPVAFNIGAGTWTGWGPFDFQLSRILAYAGYFLLGVIIGATEFNKGIFNVQATVIGRWKSWLALSLLLYALITLNTTCGWLRALVMENRLHANTAWLIYYTVYAASCAASCLAFIGLFRTKANTTNSWWRSLSANAYLIYLLHYVFVVWMQFGLMEWAIAAWLKFIIVFFVSVTLSWFTAGCLRKIPVIRRYL
jgi:surface polysaccharide O-acyltransferase-like enzyme